jgi:hypothetical protein
MKLKQRTAVSSGDKRTRDGRFAAGNKWRFKPGQSGNPAGRPPKSVESIELLNALTARNESVDRGYAAAARLIRGEWRLNPKMKISTMEALRMLKEVLET